MLFPQPSRLYCHAWLLQELVSKRHYNTSSSSALLVNEHEQASCSKVFVPQTANFEAYFHPRSRLIASRINSNRSVFDSVHLRDFNPIPTQTSNYVTESFAYDNQLCSLIRFCVRFPRSSQCRRLRRQFAVYNRSLFALTTTQGHVKRRSSSLSNVSELTSLVATSASANTYTVVDGLFRSTTPSTIFSTVTHPTNAVSMLHHQSINAVVLDRLSISHQQYSMLNSSSRTGTAISNNHMARTVLRLTRANSTTSSTDGDHDPNKPNWVHLQQIVLRLTDSVPQFFNLQHDYTIYREDVEFDNRIWNIRVRGLRSYWYQIACLSTWGKVCSAAVHMQIVNIWPSIEDGTVRLRWRVVYVPVYQIYKLRGVPRDDLDALYERVNKVGKWYDGYSVFHVDGEGLVFKHVVDKVMPDESRLNNEKLSQKLQRRLLGAATAPKM